MTREHFFSFEHKTAPLLSKKNYYIRLGKYVIFAVLLLGISLLIWVLGYHYLAMLPWVDSLLNASMILGGMGPVDSLQTDNAKVFASLYAIYSGVLLLSVFWFVMAPVIHRVLHKIHLSER